jgi:hypothetical protein
MATGGTGLAEETSKTSGTALISSEAIPIGGSTAGSFHLEAKREIPIGSTAGRDFFCYTDVGSSACLRDSMVRFFDLPITAIPCDVVHPGDLPPPPPVPQLGFQKV